MVIPRPPRPAPRRSGTATLLAAATIAALSLSACGIASAPRHSRSATPSTSATLAPSPTPSIDPIARLTLAQRVGQLFIVGSAATSAERATIAAVRDRHVGGVFLSGRSTAGAAGTAAVVEQLTAASTDGVPLSVSTDQEGGQVQVLRGPGFSVMPSGVAQGGLAPNGLTASATTWGHELASAGINLDLAPVADIVPPGAAASNPPVGGFGRQLGSDEASVRAHAAAFAAGLRAAGVQSVAKHFPGLGHVTANTDTTAGVTDRTVGPTSPDVDVYRGLIAGGVDAVMLSTAVYTRIDSRQPAAFSPIVVRLLRDDVGLGDGIVMTDDLSGATQVAAIAPGDRAIRAIAAGVDQVLVSRTPTVAAGMIDAVVARAAADRAFRAEVDAAARRVLAWKAAHLHS